MAKGSKVYDALGSMLRHTPYRIQRRLPDATVEALDLLLPLLMTRARDLVILQVGASDGITNDPLAPLLAAGIRHAVLIEPNPYAFARLQEIYAHATGVTLLPLCIADHEGEVTLYRARRDGVSEDRAKFHLQLASFYREHLIKHGVPDEQIEGIVVPCRTLTSIASELSLAQIDLLQIDVEGFDAQVVSMALSLPVLPRCINFEHRHLSEHRDSVYEQLADHGYLCLHGTWNSLAIQADWLPNMA